MNPSDNPRIPQNGKPHGKTGRPVNDIPAQDTLPWWKEPMMWLVLGLPASVVVAGIWTIILASRSMP